jgi:hypothetical protein
LAGVEMPFFFLADPTTTSPLGVKSQGRKSAT